MNNNGDTSQELHLFDLTVLKETVDLLLLNVTELHLGGTKRKMTKISQST